MKTRAIIISIAMIFICSLTAEAQERTSQSELIKSLNAALKKQVVPIRPLPAIRHHLADTSDRGRPRKTPVADSGEKEIPLLDGEGDAEFFLDGIMPGVDIIEEQGQPNTVPLIRIAGMIEMMPLILIDGMEGDFARLNKKDMKSIEVLSDPAAIALYGYKGRNGVLLVTTRQGRPATQKTPFAVEYTGSVTMSSRTATPKINFDYGDWLDARRGVYGDGFMISNSLTYKGNEDLTTVGTDWQAMIFDKTFFSTDHILRFTGGGGRVSYDVSGMFSGDGGIFSGRERYTHSTIHAGIAAKPFHWWDITAIADFAMLTDRYPDGMVKSGYYSMISRYGFPFEEVRSSDGNFTPAAIRTGYAAMSMDNAVAHREERIYAGGNIRNEFRLIGDILKAGLTVSGYRDRKGPVESPADKALLRADAEMVYGQSFEGGHRLDGLIGLDVNHFRSGFDFTDMRQYLRLEYSWKDRYRLQFVQSHDRINISDPEPAALNNDSFAGKVSWNIGNEEFMRQSRHWLSGLQVYFETGKTLIQGYSHDFLPFISGGLESVFLKERLAFAGKVFTHEFAEPDVVRTVGWEINASWRNSRRMRKDNLMYSVYANVWDDRIVTEGTDFNPRFRFNAGFNLKYAGFSLKTVFAGTGRRNWLPDSDDSLFYGMHGSGPASAGLLLRNHEALNAMGTGTLGTGDPAFMQNAAFVRLKNLRLEYSFSGPALSKAGIQGISVFCEGKNLFFLSPLQRQARGIDPEMVYPGTTVGAGDKYPLLRTVELGVKASF